MRCCISHVVLDLLDLGALAPGGTDDGPRLFSAPLRVVRGNVAMVFREMLIQHGICSSGLGVDLVRLVVRRLRSLDPAQLILQLVQRPLGDGCEERLKILRDPVERLACTHRLEMREVKPGDVGFVQVGVGAFAFSEHEVLGGFCNETVDELVSLSKLSEEGVGNKVRL